MNSWLIMAGQLMATLNVAFDDEKNAHVQQKHDEQWGEKTEENQKTVAFGCKEEVTAVRRQESCAGSWGGWVGVWNGCVNGQEQMSEQKTRIKRGCG